MNSNVYDEVERLVRRAKALRGLADNMNKTPKEEVARGMSVSLAFAFSASDLGDLFEVALPDLHEAAIRVCIRVANEAKEQASECEQKALELLRERVQ